MQEFKTYLTYESFFFFHVLYYDFYVKFTTYSYNVLIVLVVVEGCAVGLQGTLRLQQRRGVETVCEDVNNIVVVAIGLLLVT